jgi:AcrR family transcriptional regulator
VFASARVETAAPLGGREPKKLQTKDRIIECAVDPFASRGYDARATVFNHLAQKEDIVSEVFRQRVLRRSARSST